MAKQMSLSCQFISAEDALRYGLVNEVVPHENLIRQMYYSGMQNEKIEMVLSQLGFNKIPKCWLELIYNNCISDNEEAVVIEENRRRLLLKIELYESTTIRDKFIDGEVYEALLKWFQEDLSIHTFPLKEILMQRDKRSLIENAVMSGMSFKQLNEAWLLKFSEKLTIDMYESFNPVYLPTIAILTTLVIV